MLPFPASIFCAPSPLFQCLLFACAPGASFAAAPLYLTPYRASAPVLQMDLAPAYPFEAGVSRWVRRLDLHLSGRLQLSEDFTLQRRTGETARSLMTPCAPDLVTPGVVRLAPFDSGGRACELRFDASVLAVATEAIPLSDPRLGGAWGKALHRLRFTWRDTTSLTGRYDIRFRPRLRADPEALPGPSTPMTAL